MNNFPFDDQYDVIVVGGGPAGSLAAQYAAKGGAKTLLLEKDSTIGIPVRCAEGIGKKGLEAVMEPDEKWISSRVHGAILVSPYGERVYLENSLQGYILNRKQFDYEMSLRAAAAGAVIRTKTRVTGLITENGFIGGVIARFQDKEFSIKSRIVIGADGVESMVGRRAGIVKTVKMHDMESCAQATLANVTVEEGYCQFFFGNKLVPGGYAWVFPKGNGQANVGLGISGDYGRKYSVIENLWKFIHTHFPEGAVVSFTSGGVPCAPAPKKICGNGIMLAGDAACQPNPLTGGGIANALLAGKLAGTTALEAVIEGDFSERSLNRYYKQWKRTCGKDHQLYYRLKEGVFSIKDEAFESIAKAINSINPENRTIGAVFKEALKTRPQLLLDVLKVFI